MSHWHVTPGIHRGVLQPSLTTPHLPTNEFTTLDIDHAPGWASEALTPSPYHPSSVINLNGFDED